jgi:hypothetical protein
MCKYKKDKPQPKNLPYPRVTFTSECGFNLMLSEGYNMDWRNNGTYRTQKIPKGKCMKCGCEIEVTN